MRRKIEYEVPTEVMKDFCCRMLKTGFPNRITGVNDWGNVLIDVVYQKNEQKEMEELSEHYMNLIHWLEDKRRMELEEEDDEQDD